MTTNWSPQGNRSKQMAEGPRLTGEQVEMIEEALASVGDFGEVRLVIEKSRLRFIVTQKSIDALEWQKSHSDR